MSYKSIIPEGLKSLYHSIGWYLKNYKQIKRNSRLLSTHFHGPIAYDADGMIISQNSDFINEPRFKNAYKAAADTNPWPGFSLQWRVYIVCYFANQVRHLEGDFVECGVNTGAYAKAIINYIDFNSLNKIFYLLDTFEGLDFELVSQEELAAGVNRYIDKYKGTYEGVVDSFKNDHVKIIKGAVPGTLPLCTAEKVAFLSIDMNCVEPEIAAAEYFYDKMVTGGVIILDDYGFPKHIKQKEAFDAFALRRKIEILSLPTGQGIIFKS